MKLKIDFVLVGKNNREVFKRRENHPLGIAPSVGGNRHRQKKVEESSDESTNF